MATDFASSETAKALKVIGGLNTLAGEYDAQDDPSVAATLRKLAGFPFDDLAKLHDLIVNHELP